MSSTRRYAAKPSSASDVDLFAHTDALTNYRWIPSAWTLSSGNVINTLPGAELLSNPGAEGTYTSGLPTGWSSVVHTGTRAEDNANQHGGSAAIHLTTAAGQRELLVPLATVTNGSWYRTSLWINRISGLNPGTRPRNASSTVNDWMVNAKLVQSTTGWLRYDYIVNADSTSIGQGVDTGTGAAECITDDSSVKSIAFSEILLSRQAWNNVIVSASINQPTGMGWGCYGVMCNLDSPTNPLNWIMAIYTGFRFELYKVVNLVPTRIWTDDTTATWRDGELLEITKTGTTYKVYYGGVQMGTTQTITECQYYTYAGLVDFSGATFNSFSARKYGTNTPTLRSSTPTWAGATYPAGKAVVSLRFDGCYADDPTVQAQLEARGLKGGFALIRTLIGISGRMTLAQCYAVAAGGHEIMAHGGDTNPANFASYELQVAQYAEELRLMGFNIDMHVQSGVFTGEYYLDSASKYGSAEDLLVRQHYHCYEAYIVGYHDQTNALYELPFPTASRFGKQHDTLDQSNATAAIAKIDAAIAGGHGLEFLLHTHYLDDVGYISTTDWLAILDYLQTKVGTGDLVVLTPTQQILATAA